MTNGLFERFLLAAHVPLLSLSTIAVSHGLTKLQIKSNHQLIATVFYPR